MYWTTTDDARIVIPTLPAITIGTATDFTLKLVTEAGEALTDAYLFVGDPDQAGLIQAKLSTGSSYMNIEGPFDAACYLGPIAASTETNIDFRVQLPSGTSDGYRIIPIFVGHDDGAQLPSGLWDTDWTALWATDWTDLDLWREDW